MVATLISHTNFHHWISDGKGTSITFHIHIRAHLSFLRCLSQCLLQVRLALYNPNAWRFPSPAGGDDQREVSDRNVAGKLPTEDLRVPLQKRPPPPCVWGSLKVLLQGFRVPPQPSALGKPLPFVKCFLPVTALVSSPEGPVTGGLSTLPILGGSGSPTRTRENVSASSGPLKPEAALLSPGSQEIMRKPLVQLLAVPSASGL